MQRTLLLNANYEPIAAITARKAVSLLIGQKVETIEEYDNEIYRAQFISVKAPSVVRLRYYVRVPYRTTLRITKKGVMIRDQHRCAYCSHRATTIDHIRPRSRGGKHTWQNVVACCKHCNQVKGNKQLSELQWHLRTKPFAPTGVRAVAGLLNPEPAWLPYIKSMEAALAS